jgi:hypothetical protein
MNARMPEHDISPQDEIQPILSPPPARGPSSAARDQSQPGFDPTRLKGVGVELGRHQGAEIAPVADGEPDIRNVKIECRCAQS